MNRALSLTSFLLVACGARTPLDQPLSVASNDAGDDGALGPCVDEDIAHDDAGAYGLAVDGETVFWITNDTALHRHDASGNKVLAKGFFPTPIALDATYVYGIYNSEIRAVPRAGGDVETRATVQSVVNLVIRDDTLYVASYAPSFQGKVVALSPVLGEPRVVAQTDLPGFSGPPIPPWSHVPHEGRIKRR